MLTVRQTLSAATAAALLLTGACQSGESQQNQADNAANAAQQQTVPRLPIPTPEPPMSREQLLVATMRAASAFAAGSDDAELQKSLANKDYEFRIRFGCDGPDKAGTDEPFGWTYDAKTRALKVRATPALSPKDVPVKALAGVAFETVEGFWLRRPWLLTPVCPKAEDDAASDETSEAAAVPASQSVGIAQFFTATDPRTMRRSGRPYEATKKLEADQPPSGGFDLVLTGRLVALPDGRVIACTRSQTGDRPACLISVQFGKVSIERADTHEQLAQWGSG
jgi:hypothetical protein